MSCCSLKPLQVVTRWIAFPTQGGCSAQRCLFKWKSEKAKWESTESQLDSYACKEWAKEYTVHFNEVIAAELRWGDLPECIFPSKCCTKLKTFWNSQKQGMLTWSNVTVNSLKQLFLTSGPGADWWSSEHHSVGRGVWPPNGYITLAAIICSDA